MSIESAINLFMRDAGLSTGTQKAYRCTFDRFNAFCGGDKSIEAFTTTDLIGFREYMRTEHPQASMSHTMAAIRGFFKYFEVRTELPLSVSYVKIVPDKSEHHAFNELSKNEIETLRRAIKSKIKPTKRSKRDLALLEVLYSTGCRRAEIVNLKRSDLNMANASAEILGKGNKYRTVFLGKKAERALQDYLATRTDPNPYVFPGLSATEPCDYHTINYRFDVWTKLVGFKVHPHMMRKSLATHLDINGAPLQKIQGILGHSSPTTTMNYIMNSQSRLKKAHNQYFGDNRRFVFTEERDGRILVQAEVFVGEGLSAAKAKRAIQEAVAQLLD